MESKATQPKSLSAYSMAVENHASKISIGEIFNDRTGAYLNELTLFLSRFNTIPNFIEGTDIDCRRANKWLVANYAADIKDMHYNKRFSSENKIAECDDIFYFLYDDLLIYFDTNLSIAKLLFRKTDINRIDIIIAGIKKFIAKKEKQKPEISLIVNSGHGIGTKSFQITKPKLCIEDNYNDDFKIIHQTILRRLSKKNDKGLVLLHGKPGTGKTSYIRYLITMLKKDVIFLPPNMAGGITDPNLMSVLIDNPNSIFIIEDAENIVVDREKDGRSPVAALLNISDGLLSDCLNIQVICSFNTDISKVDNALIRKGRLIARYEFKELETTKAQLLSNKLCFHTKVYKPMTLTEIYNQSESAFEQPKQKSTIGFMANNN
jgi:hypothetical protein